MKKIVLKLKLKLDSSDTDSIEEGDDADSELDAMDEAEGRRGPGGLQINNSLEDEEQMLLH